jgi:hypothetical protein
MAALSLELIGFSWRLRLSCGRGECTHFLLYKQ